MQLEGKNQRWGQDRRGNRVSVIVEVLEATAMLEAKTRSSIQGSIPGARYGEQWHTPLRVPLPELVVALNYKLRA